MPGTPLPDGIAALPTPRTPLVGRGREVASALALLLEEAVPLLTLTGAGGVGKTRLALAVTQDAAGAFADGVAFIDLSPVRDPALVLPAVARALGVQDAGGRSLAETLAAFLRPRQLLLILDNCEQVLDAAPDVAALLSACPALQVLATSRAPLRLRGEHLLPVAPLPVPDPGRPPDELAETEAVVLFVQRARAADPAFALDGENSAAVAEVCQRLDGLPLAIELAAARLRILSPEALLALMTERLRVLTGGARDVPVRQRALRDTIGWSYDLLTPEEQALFRRLAVFAGGFTLEAAERVAGTPPTTLDAVAALVDQSLLHRSEVGGAPRFGMLETIREFGLERLEASGEGEATRRAHFVHFLDLAEAYLAARYMPTEHPGANLFRMLDRLEAEYANLRGALSWAVAHDAQAALHLAGTLMWFWEFRGHASEGRAWLEAVMALPEAAAPSFALARALAAASQLASYQGEIARAAALREETLAVRRALGDQWGVVTSLCLAGRIAVEQGDLERAARLLAEALAGARALGHEFVVTMALNGLGELAIEEGNFERAETLFEEALARAREVGDQIRVADYLSNLGRVARRRGDSSQAVAHFEEALTLYRALQERSGVAISLRELACIAAARRDATQAAALLRESLALQEEVRDRRGIAASLETAARLIGSSRPAEAARLLGTAAALREAIGSPLRLSERTEHDQLVETTRAALGEETFAEAWTTGLVLTPECAVAKVLDLAFVRQDRDSRVSVISPAAIHQDGQTVGGAFGLTRREREVLGLLAQRLTDPEIAERLYLSPHTASTHVKHVLAKLGAANRREAAALAARHGLA